MNSKLPPKCTILFLLLFLSITNKGECAPNGAELYPAQTATTGEAIRISTPTSIVSGDVFKNVEPVLESYQWYTIIERYNRD